MKLKTKKQWVPILLPLYQWVNGIFNFPH